MAGSLMPDLFSPVGQGALSDKMSLTTSDPGYLTNSI